MTWRPDDPERELVAAAAAGDRDAFRALYLAHGETIHGFLRRRSDIDLADDLTAEVFCRVWASMPRYVDTGVPFRAYLVRVARNLLFNALAKKSRTEVPLEAGDDHVVGGPEDVAIMRLGADRIRRFVATLPEQQRTIVELRLELELSVPETAAAVGISEESVRSTLYRALQTIRRAFADEFVVESR